MNYPIMTVYDGRREYWHRRNVHQKGGLPALIFEGWRRRRRGIYSLRVKLEAVR